jgi:predicted NAD/FAD-binding protein
VISAQNPSTKGRGVPMLVTFNSQRVIEKVQKRIDLPHPTHSVSLQNLIIMSTMRYLQGRDGLHYCGTFTTPEGGHDLSFMSGLVVAHAIGADYPFAIGHTDAVADFKQMQKMMLKSGARRPL